MVNATRQKLRKRDLCRPQAHRANATCLCVRDRLRMLHEASNRSCNKASTSRTPTPAALTMSPRTPTWMLRPEVSSCRVILLQACFSTRTCVLRTSACACTCTRGWLSMHVVHVDVCVYVSRHVALVVMMLCRYILDCRAFPSWIVGCMCVCVSVFE